MPIDAQLKSLIQSENITLSESEKQDLAKWLRTTWMQFCIKHILDNKLAASYNALLSAKIEKLDDKDPNATKEIEISTDFIWDLFLECNKEYQWIDLKKANVHMSLGRSYLWDRLSKQDDEDVAEEENNEEAQYGKVRTKYREYYNQYSISWFKNQLKDIDYMTQKELFYKTALNAFLKANEIGFFDVENEYNKLCKKQLDELKSNNEATLKIIQNNGMLIHQVFVEFLKKIKIFDQINIDEDIGYIRELINTNDLGIETNKKLNKNFTYALSNLLQKNTVYTQKNLSIVLNDTDNYWINNDSLLAELVAKDLLESIEISNKQESIFQYTRKDGVVKNNQFLKPNDVNRIDIVNDLLNDKELVKQITDKSKQPRYFGYTEEHRARDLEAYFQKMTQTTLQENSQDFIYDNRLPIYKYGKSGIQSYLAGLDAQFNKQLQANAIQKGYRLFLPNKELLNSASIFNISLVNAMNFFLKQQLSDKKDYVCSCQYIKLALPVTEQTDIAAIGELIELLSKAHVKEFTFITSKLTKDQIDTLQRSLKQVNFTEIRFQLEDANVALSLEAINDNARQSIVPYYNCDSTNQVDQSKDIINQPEPVTVAKIKALMNKEIELKPIESKIGIQHQHQYEHDVEQKTEVNIQQSWQITEKTEVQQQTGFHYDVMSGDEQNSLISWQDIEAAYDPNHPRHIESKNKIGEEILNYQYKGRDLKDLWQRLTGHLVVTKQDVLVDFGKEYEWLKYFSTDIPKQITYKTLLQIVRHPHLFQDGLCLNSLPDSIKFELHHGALFTTDKKQSIDIGTTISKNEEKVNHFKLQINAVPKAALPSAAHIDTLINSNIPSVGFYHELLQIKSQYAAWHAWRGAFSALNLFNHEGIKQVNGCVKQFLQSAEKQQDLALHYFVQALNYYAYQKIAKQQTTMLLNQALFEYLENEKHQRGDANSLSIEQLNQLPHEMRQQLNKHIVDLLNNTQYAYQELIASKENKTQRSLLKSLINYHHEKWQKDTKISSIFSEVEINQFIEKIDDRHIIKFCEFFSAEDTSRVYSMLSMLLSLERRFGDKALQDFSECFILPAVNFAPLTDNKNQIAFDKLLHLSPLEYHWWQHLTKQHMLQSGYADFTSLFQSFEQFLSELSALGLRDQLYMPCPLQDINNMQVTLDRVITVLKKSKKPAEQIKNLIGLDWSVSGVALAVTKSKYQFLSADMKINGEGESLLELIKKKYHAYPDEYVAQFEHNDAKPFWYSELEESASELDKLALSQATLLSFYRYIGYQKYTAPMPVYKKLLDNIYLPQGYSVIEPVNGISYVNGKLETPLPPHVKNRASIIVRLLPVIAHATTGKRGLDALPQQEDDRAAVLNQMIEAAYECSRERWGNHDEPFQILLDRANAVSIKKLGKTLEQCYQLCKRHEETEKISLSMQEITQVLRWCRRSDAAAVALEKKENYQFFEMRAALLSSLDGFSLNDTLSVTVNLLGTYNQYLLDAFARISKYNPDTDYASFVAVAGMLGKSSFSFENKGRLLRIISLIPFNYATIFPDAYCIEEFFSRLAYYQQKAGDKALNEFLSALSALVPNGNKNSFDIDKIQALLEQCIQKVDVSISNDIRPFVLSQFSDCKIDPEVEEIKDADFYQNEEALEKEFVGLGAFYKPIKSIILSRYPVLFGENKQLAWNYFLTLMKKIENPKEQEQVLQILLESKHKNLDLNTLNLWVETLLSRSEYKTKYKQQMTLINQLNIGLIQHPNKKAYTKILSRWLNLFSNEENQGFACLLNDISSMPEGDVFLDNFFEVSFELQLLSRDDNYPWHKEISKLFNAAKKKNVSIDVINQLFFMLKEFCAADRKNNDGYHSATFAQFFLAWISNIDQTLSLTAEIAKNWNEKNKDRIYYQLLILSQVKKFNVEKAYQFLCNMSDAELISLASLYKLKPTPSHKLLASMLKGDITPNELIMRHTMDPHNERSEEKLRKQFNDEELWPYVDRLQHSDNSGAYRSVFNKEFPEQYKYINKVGYEFRTLSLSEIGNKLRECKQFLKTAKTSEETLTAYLTVFALIREALYKTSVAPAILWPSAVQTLAVLSAINQLIEKGGKIPLFMQMATGEGKSLLAVFLAPMIWVKGDPVTIVTHRASLALRDANTFSSLFSALGIESEHLTADKYRQRFLLRKLSRKVDQSQKSSAYNGVYYAEFSDIALIRLQQLLDTGEDIEDMSFVIDEADEIILHNQTDNNLTQTTGGFDAHPHAWVFEGLADFLNNNLDTSHLPIKVSISTLVAFLCKAYPLAINVCQDPEFLSMLPVYLNAAWHASSLKEDDDFIIKKHPDGEGYYAAILINDKPMLPNVTFNGLIQQALHGRLNYEARKNQTTKKFAVAPESILFSSMTPDATLRWMKQSGSLIALSATIGSNAERWEMKNNYNFDYIKLPKMQSSLRVDYPPKFCKNQEKQIEAISNICKHYTDKRKPSKARALLIVVDNIELAEKLKQHLQKSTSDCHVSTLHAGLEDLSDETLSQVERETGKTNHILIAMSGLISRGFDVKLSSARQLVVINTYLKSEVDETQVKGRGGRVNQLHGMRDKGKFYAIYDLEKEKARYGITDVNNLMLISEEFKEQQYFSHYKHESELRLHSQLLGITKTVIQNHFFQLWSVIFKNNNVIKMTREKVLKLFTETLDEMSNYFSSMTQTAADAQQQYNVNLVQLYEKMLNKLPEILGDLAPKEVADIKAALLDEITTQQQHLLAQRNQVITKGADKPKIKVYHQWKDGVKFNAYLDVGKQGWGNYFFETVNSMWLSQEQRNSINDGKEALNKKIIKKQQKKHNFLSQIKLMMEYDKERNDHSEDYLNIYKNIFVKDPQISLSIKHHDSLEMVKMQAVQKKLEKRQSIYLVHDPLIGKAYEIHLVAKEFSEFSHLQQVINEVYKRNNIKEVLPYYINKKNGFYHLRLNFSGNQFDHLNRKKIFGEISTSIGVELDNLFDAIMPSPAAMQRIVKEFKGLCQKSSLTFDSSMTINSHLSNEHRVMYFARYFEPLLEFIKNNYDELPYEAKPFAMALLHYDNKLSYMNESGQLCESDALPFSNFSELLETENKRKALQFIQNQMVILNKSSFKDTLLCSYQFNSLAQLSKEIVKSKNNESLQTIFKSWETSSVQLNEQIVLVSELMSRRIQKQNGLLFLQESPNCNLVCEQIENMINLPVINLAETLSI